MIRLLLVMSLFFAFIVPQAWGQVNQYPNANRQTMWNNITDGFHTMGQSPTQAAFTKRRLHNARTQARLKSINQARQKAWMRGSN